MYKFIKLLLISLYISNVLSVQAMPFYNNTMEQIYYYKIDNLMRKIKNSNRL